MDSIQYIERTTGEVCEEQVYGAAFLRLLYGNGLVSRFLGTPLAHALARIPFFSALYGRVQNTRGSASKIAPFIKAFNVDTSEFADPASFTSFNDFFTRKLNPSARPIHPDPDVAVIPADGRYLFYPDIDKAEGFVVKGEKFNLETLLDDAELAKKYAHGAMVIARLCPVDYHRYHFPCQCVPTDTKLINGWLYSVNPLAIKKDIEIFTQNKRTLCTLNTERFGEVLFLEIGATFVGAIHQTYTPERLYEKGAEKGFFSFGASSLILLFPPHTIHFDQDLLEASAKHVEIRCQMGQPMGLSFAEFGKKA